MTKVLKEFNSGVVLSHDKRKNIYIVSVLGKEVTFEEKPFPAEINVLFTLVENGVGEVTSLEDICYRVSMSKPSIILRMCRLRKKLSDDWTIESFTEKHKYGSGYRLLYLGK